MNKTVLISVGAIAIVGLFVLAYTLAGSKTSPVSTTQNVPAGEQSQNLPPGSTNLNTTGSVVEPIVAGTTVQAADFLSDPAVVKDANNPGYYSVGYQAVDNPPYAITYISDTNYFNIALLQEPIGPVRKDAEQYLMAHLGITAEKMCQLDYMVSVPEWVNSQFAGKSLGFSFCPGAVTLPK